MVTRFVGYLLLSIALGINCWSQMRVVERMPVARPNAPLPAPSTSGAAPGSNGIQYNGGPVMNDPHGVNVYFIWYGDWSKDPAAKTIVNDFISHIGGTAYFNINSSYYDLNRDGEKDPIVNRVNFGGSIIDNYSRGADVSDNDVGCIIQNAAVSGRLPFDLNGQYFVLTSADVVETSGFCTAYCAFHGYQPTDSTTTQDSCGMPVVNSDQLDQTLIGSFVGNTNQCPNYCAFQYPASPNNDAAADGMVNFIAHELSESATDPLGNGWINPDGTENGDLCQLALGHTELLPNGSLYNVKFGKRPYLIQEIWVNARGGYCAMRWDD